MLVVAFIVSAGLFAEASSVQQLSVSELVQGSDLIFKGHVLELRSLKDSTPEIFTRVTFQVQELIKGHNPGRRIELDFAGGTVGGLTLSISDMRIPKVGETGIYLSSLQSAVRFIHSMVGIRAIFWSRPIKAASRSSPPWTAGPSRRSFPILRQTTQIRLIPPLFVGCPWQGLPPTRSLSKNSNNASSNSQE